MEFCPVCMLRKGLVGGVASGESSEEVVKPTPELPAQRFEHYELVTGEDGTSVELGRGSMGVTYKAFDIDLRCPVALKVISEQYLGDESARLRFLREARAAASVRHPNVASVFRLGRTGENYFYAMEFVEGETLEKLIKRSGRLDVKLALEIATQVAAGLAAVHEQNLVHRDIKPTNIMVRLKEERSVTAKIIDLGKALEALLKSPAIPGLTESLTDLYPTEWQTILARLRRARLLAGEDPQNPGHLDTHPLVREYFGEQLRSQRSEAWKECNRRLFHYYQTLAPQLPNRFREMEPLFSAVTCGCEAGLFREALHEVYIPRIQRGNDSFAANVLGARGPLLSALIHFFEDGRWGSFSETKIEGQSLSAEDQLFILMQAAKYLTATQGAAAQEARICYERGSWTAITTDGRFASHRHFFPTKRRGRS
jgi:Protein kinase domain